MQLLAVAWYSKAVLGILAVTAVITGVGGALGYLASWVGGVRRQAGKLRHSLRGGNDTPIIQSLDRSEPTDTEVRILDAVIEHSLTEASLPAFANLAKTFDRQGLDLRQLLESMPANLLAVIGQPFILREDSRLRVTLDGLQYCDRGGELLDLIAVVLAYLALREWRFSPGASEPTLRITSEEARRDLGLSPDRLRQTYMLFCEYTPEAWTQLEGADDQWTVTVSAEQIRRYRGIRDGPEYLRVLTGDSFKHQFSEEAGAMAAANADLLEAAVRLHSNVDELRRRIAHARSSGIYWTDLLARDVFETYEPTLIKRPHVHRAVSDAYLRFHELNQRVPRGEEILAEEAPLLDDAVDVAAHALETLAALSDELSTHIG